jgi:hypothetical protein
MESTNHVRPETDGLGKHAPLSECNARLSLRMLIRSLARLTLQGGAAQLFVHADVINNGLK